MKPKYIVINLDRLGGVPETVASLLANLANKPEAIELPKEGSADEFFVLKLKDMYAAPALGAYAAAASDDGAPAEYVDEVMKLAHRSMTHPDRKRPD